MYSTPYSDFTVIFVKVAEVHEPPQWARAAERRTRGRRVDYKKMMECLDDIDVC